MAALIRIRRDTSNNWASNDPQLAQGELGLDTDTGVIKVGNGSNVWSELYSIGVYNSNDRISKTVDTDTGSLIVDEFGKLYFDRGGTLVFADTGNLFAGTGNSNFKISLDNHTGDVTEYNFSHDGKITLPAGGLISTGWDSSSSVASIWATDTEAALDWTGNTTIYARTNGVEIYTSTSGDEKFWNFTNGGILTLPDGGQLGDLEGYTTLFNTDGVALAAGLNNAVVVSPTDGTYIYANAAQYIFDANGTVHLPGNIQLNSSSVILGSTSNTGDDMYIEAIDFSVEDHTVIMVTSHGFMDGDKIYINNIGPGSTQELDDTYCYVMVIDPDNFEIYSDKALTMPIWDAGYTTFVYSGQQPLNGTVAKIHDAGSVNISTIMPGPNHDAGSINLNVSDNIWNFGPDGTVTFPMGGRIGATKGGTSFDGGPNGGTTSLSNYYANGNYAACVTAYSNGRLYITTYNDGGDNPSRAWEFNNDGNLVLPANGYILNSDFTVYGGTGGAGGGISIGDFGEGFSLTASNKVVTNKLYSTNLTEPTQHYRLEVDTNGVVVLPDFGAITSPNYGFSFNKDSGKTGVPELGTGVTFATESLDSDILDGQVYMGSGYGEFRSIYNKVDSTESGLAYAGVEGFNYAQLGDVNFAGMVSQTPNIDSMYALSLNEQGQITIGFTQAGQTQTSNDWSVVVGTLNTDYTVNGLFANTNVTVIGSGLSSWTFGTDGNLTLPAGGEIHSAAGIGNVYINSNDGSHNYTWTFGTNGNLVLPANSYVLNSDLSVYGVSDYGKTVYTGWFRNANTVVTLDNITSRITAEGIMQVGTVYSEDQITGTAWAWNGIRNKNTTFSSFSVGGTNWVLPGDWLNISETPLDNNFEVATVTVFGLGDGHLYRITYVGSTNGKWSVVAERIV